MVSGIKKQGTNNQPSFYNPHLFTKIKAMKRTFMLSLAATAVVALVFSACQPSRVWANKKKKKEEKEYREEVYRDEGYREPEEYRRPAPPPPPRYYASAALVISPSPGFVMKQHPSNGRYYHRSPGGYLYWKGYDNRFYIDQSYLSRIRYSRWEYDEWKRYSRQSR